ncbi:MDR/SDR family oxidoreductase [Aspergillus brunneoviolaceus CBS 621.78]|uniref:KR-domain-containing protein n=1 Tax=Aspergillus brunneoviolaceus CBS 621.78 TaxID=1450534 RepID=A0ACD1FW78_9EURO|nr:KR-domain-containing protein [Aspergillus brunneoviolaceus CBS 621.78]RAH41241.1 KR-domain-containing protein [Aspergillus brunneoviolaceus CBS 621.78]
MSLDNALHTEVQCKQSTDDGKTVQRHRLTWLLRFAVGLWNKSFCFGYCYEEIHSKRYQEVDRVIDRRLLLHGTANAHEGYIVNRFCGVQCAACGAAMIAVAHACSERPDSEGVALILRDIHPVPLVQLNVEEMEETPQRGNLDESEILVHVHAAPGDDDDETGIFSEGAGEVLQAGSRSGFQAGDRVFLRYPTCCRTFLRLPVAFAAPLLPQISFVEAAALPTAGLMALYALRTLGRISTDDSVLVRHAANAVGQLAKQLAQLMGAKSSSQSIARRSERSCEQNSTFPRSSSFPSTRGGVDMVLNFDSQELEGSLDALAPFGTLVSLDLSNNRPHDHPRLLRNAASRCITLAAVDVTKLHGQKPAIVQQLLRQLSQLMLDGKVRYPVGSARSRPTAVRIGRGARNLLVLSRSGAWSESARQLFQDLGVLGVTVVAPTCDIIQPNSLADVLKEHASKLPPIRGCLQCTMVLRDAVFTNMTYEDFIISTRLKVFGSWNLHALLPKGMNFFVLLSSIGGVLGAPSQSNYCAGNTFKDALARYRVQLGERAVAIDLGMMLGEGVVAETAGMLDSLRRLGYFMDVVVGIECPAAMEAKGFDPPYWMHRPYFRPLHLVESHLPTPDPAAPSSAFGAAAEGAGKAGAGADAASVLRASPSVAVAAAQIVQWVVAKLAQILGLPVEEIDVDRSVHANGINSLVAVELRNWFGKRIGADVAVFEILGNMSLAELSRSAAQKTRFRN